MWGLGDGVGLGVAPGSSNSSTVTAGGTANYSLVIGGQGLTGTATLTCNGAPTAATCNVPASENLDANSPSNFPVTISTTARNSASLLRSHSTPSWMWATVLLGLLAIPATGKCRKRFKILPALLITLTCSCGGGSSSPTSNPGGTPAGAYTVNVTATMGSTKSSLPLTLVVQ